MNADNVSAGIYCDGCMTYITEQEDSSFYECLDCNGYHLCIRCHDTVQTVRQHLNEHWFVHNCTHPAVVAQQISSAITFRDKLMCLFDGYRNRPCIGAFTATSIDWLTFGDVGAKSKQLATLLSGLEGSRVILSANNCVNWLITDFACVFSRKTSICCSPPAIAQDAVHILKSSSPGVGAIICGNSDEVRIWSEALSSIHVSEELSILSIDELQLEANDRLLDTCTSASDLDLFTVIFTSGSTGKPKGIPLTFQQWSERIGLTLSKNKHGLKLKWSPEPMAWYSFAPLSHMLDRTSSWTTLMNGGRVVIGSGDKNQLFKELRMARPTKLAAVPRFWNAVHQLFLERLAIGMGMKDGNGKGKSREEVIEEFRADMFDRVRLVVTGGAITPSATLEFLNEVFFNVVESYGTTEAGALFRNGVVVDDIEWKLESVPEMGYYVTDDPPRGEVLVRKKQGCAEISTNYWGVERDSESESGGEGSIENSGWWRTGDIAVLVQSESREGKGEPKYKIIDRKADLFKLHQGEFVSPARIEYLLEFHCPMIRNAFVFKKGEMALGCVVCLDDHDDSDADADSESIRKLIAASASEWGLASYECPSFVHVEYDLVFSVANVLLTPSGKLARQNCLNRYKFLITCADDDIEHPSPEDAIMKSIENEPNSNSNVRIGEFALDSLSVARFCQLFEEKYGLELRYRTMFHPMLSVKHISQALALRKETESENFDFDYVVWQMLQAGQSNFWDEEYENLMKSLSEIAKTKIDVRVHTQQEESNRNRNRKGGKVGVFLTGATGFLGRWLLKSLLDDDTCIEIFALVRGNGNENRLQEVYQSVFGSEQCLNGDLMFIPISKFNTNSSKGKDRKVVWIIPGDLTEPHLGMDESAVSIVSQYCSLFYHNGCVVNHVKPYSELRDANVLSTLQILKLCLMSHNHQNQKVRLHYISSVSVLDRPRVLGTDSNSTYVTPRLNLDALSSYGQTKWMSEMLVQNSNCDKICSHIHRIDLIGWPFHEFSRYFDYNRNDWVSIFLKACADLGPEIGIPDIRRSNFSMIPVDYVARAIVMSDGSADSAPTTESCHYFHWVNGVACSSHVLVEGFRGMQIVSFEKWKASLRKHQHGNGNGQALALAMFGARSQFPSHSFSLQNMGKHSQIMSENELKELIRKGIRKILALT